jgi:hypothetical protein
MDLLDEREGVTLALALALALAPAPALTLTLTCWMIGWIASSPHSLYVRTCVCGRGRRRGWGSLGLGPIAFTCNADSWYDYVCTTSALRLHYVCTTSALRLHRRRELLELLSIRHSEQRGQR